MNHRLRRLAVVAFSILVGGIFMWLSRAGTVWISSKDALCVVELDANETVVRKSFSITGPIERFYVQVIGSKKNQVRFSISDGMKLEYSISAVGGGGSFSFGYGIPQGEYEAIMSRLSGHGRAVIMISDDDHAGISGWQIISLVIVSGVIVTGLWALAARNSSNPRQRKNSRDIFIMFFLVFSSPFLYLLFHEGGHALASLAFGGFDLAASDFWGIYGAPHSGLKASVHLLPWQRSLVSMSGPALPLLVGWALFIPWRMKKVKEWWKTHPKLNLFHTFYLVMFIFPWIATAGCLLGICQDSDWRGFIENVPGQLWLVKTLLWASVAISAFIMWRVVPEAFRCIRTAFAPSPSSGPSKS